MDLLAQTAKSNDDDFVRVFKDGRRSELGKAINFINRVTFILEVKIPTLHWYVAFVYPSMATFIDTRALPIVAVPSEVHHDHR